MKMNLDLQYRIKPGEGTQFLEFDELSVLDGLVKTALLDAHDQARKANPPNPLTDIQRDGIARNVTQTYVATIPRLGSRVTSKLLRMAVDIRYMKELPDGRRVIEIPRKDKAKNKPGVWWGDITDVLDEYPEDLKLTMIQMAWLVNDVWYADSVQDGYPPSHQRFLNTLEKEMARLAGKLSDPEDEKDDPPTE